MVIFLTDSAKETTFLISSLSTPDRMLMIYNKKIAINNKITTIDTDI